MVGELVPRLHAANIMLFILVLNLINLFIFHFSDGGGMTIVFAIETLPVVCPVGRVRAGLITPRTLLALLLLVIIVGTAGGI